MMNVLITGGSGFVGLAVAEAAITQGSAVTLFADRAPPERLLRAAGGAKIKVLIGDIANRGDVIAALDATRPTHVVHAAALTPSKDLEEGQAAHVMQVNVVGTASLMEAVAGRVRHVVYLSSIAVYGGMPVEQGRVCEDRPTRPTSVYGVSKCSAEMVAQYLARKTGLTLTTVRSGPVFGPFEYESGVRSIMSPHLQMLRLAQSGVPAVLSWGLAADWMYSTDTAAGIVWLLTHPERAEGVFNLSGRSVTDLRQWGDLLARRFAGWTWRMADDEASANVAYGISEERAPLDNTRIAEAGFTPSFSLADAARHMLDWSERVQAAH